MINDENPWTKKRDLPDYEWTLVPSVTSGFIKIKKFNPIDVRNMGESWVDFFKRAGKENAEVK